MINIKSLPALSTFFVGSLLFFSLSGCKKDKTPNEEPQISSEEVVTEIVGQLAKSSNLSTFSEALEGTSLSDADVSEGLTILAVPDEALEAASAQALGRQKPLLKAGEAGFDIKDHLIKGLIKTSDLTTGKTFTTLSGKELLVFATDTSIFINGREITNKAWASGTHEVVHLLNDILTGTTAAAPGSLTVTVYDASQWTTNKPKGEPLAGAKLRLYRSKEDYKNNVLADSALSDNSGKAVFAHLFPGTYYMVGQKDAYTPLSSLINLNGGPLNSDDFGYESLIQTEQEAIALGYNDKPYDYVATYKPVDLNADGQINDADKTAKPFHSAEIEGGDAITYDLIIGPQDNHSEVPTSNGTEFVEDVQSAYWDVYNNLVQWKVINGVLSDEANCQNIQLPDICRFDTYGYTASSQSSNNLWYTHYNLLKQINRLLVSAPLITSLGNNPDQFPAGNKDQLVGLLRGLRAIVYSSMLNFYGEAPIFETIAIPTDVLRSPVQDVFTFIKQDFDAAIAQLPNQQNNFSTALSADACRAFMALNALQQKDYALAVQYSDQVINSSRYSLVGDTSAIFNDADNREVIWNRYYNQESTDVQYTNYFKNRKVTPAILYSEVLLINAEALNEQGNSQQAANIASMLNQRAGWPAISGSQSEVRTAIQTIWGRDFKRTGNRFTNLVRWGQDEALLSPLGYTGSKKLQPFPIGLLNYFPNLQQNPGY